MIPLTIGKFAKWRQKRSFAPIVAEKANYMQMWIMEPKIRAIMSDAYQRDRLALAAMVMLLPPYLALPAPSAR